jgi:DNA polymerase elongation subunit (family B)
MEIRIRDDPARNQTCSAIEIVCGERTEQLHGQERDVLAALFGLVSASDPDLILMTDADRWMGKLQVRAGALGLTMPFSRIGKYRTMDSRSYWSYGRVEHKEAAIIPDGRILIDNEQSFVYREGGLAGVLMASRLSGLSPSLASRFTPGTLISSYETYEAVRRGIMVPFWKSDAEALRKFSALRTADRGGMMFQPEPGIFADVDEIDFTSMYPSIIVMANLSPETFAHPEQEPRGFLPTALEPLLALRIRTKQLKKTDPAIAARRHDTPEYIRTMQGTMLEVMGKAATIAELNGLWGQVNAIYRNAVEQLPCAPAQEMTISRRISRLTYAHRCIEGAAVDAYREEGVPVAAGMKIRYVVRDARMYRVDPAWNADRFDILYYRELLERAWTEIRYAFRMGGGGGKDQQGILAGQEQRSIGASQEI